MAGAGGHSLMIRDLQLCLPQWQRSNQEGNGERGKIRRALRLHPKQCLFCLRSARPTRVLRKHCRVWTWKPKPKICQLHMLPHHPRIYGPGLVLLVVVASQFLNKKSHTASLVGRRTEASVCVAVESRRPRLCLHM